MKLTKKIASLLLAMVVSASLCVPAVALADVTAATSTPITTQASSYKGLYDYRYGTDASGYSLLVDILKKQGKKVTFKTSLTYAYGSGGYYTVTSKKITAKLKKGSGSFTFKTMAGDKGKGRIKLLSKKKVKISLKTTKAGGERMPLTTGGKWKTLKRAKYQYHILSIAGNEQ